MSNQIEAQNLCYETKYQSQLFSFSIFLLLRCSLCSPCYQCSPNLLPVLQSEIARFHNQWIEKSTSILVNFYFPPPHPHLTQWQQVARNDDFNFRFLFLFSICYFFYFYSTPSTEGVESTRVNSVCLCVCVSVCP